MGWEPDSTRKTSILREAACLFREKGYNGSTLRQLATRVGIKGGSIYHHFASKQEILFMIMKYTMGNLIQRVRQEIENEQGVLDKLRSAMRCHIEYHTIDADETYVTDAELRSLSADNYKIIVGMRNNYEAVYRDILREGRATGVMEITNLSITSRALLQMCTGISLWYRPDGPLTINEIEDTYMDLFCRGVLADRLG